MMKLKSDHAQATEMNELPDEELYTRFSTGDDWEAMETLIQRWHIPAWRLGRCICVDATLAEEAQQNAFLELISSRNRFESRGPGSFRSWFTRMVASHARMVLRTERRARAKKRVDPTDWSRRKGIETETTTIPFFNELRVELSQFLERLEEHCRIPVILHFLGGLTQNEVAKELGITQQTVSKRIRLGLDQLRLHFAGATEIAH